MKPLAGSAAGRLHSALRSYFRALKRERLVFRDPARTVRLTTARPVHGRAAVEEVVCGDDDLAALLGHFGNAASVRARRREAGATSDTGP
ncbi:hypothetical protein, partial [Streptomyces himalayensis]|uniref:hypothetical protein n=1 Tax=Streptomyces himalayensis TaxID=2820085 RepID=UPI001C694CC0